MPVGDDAQRRKRQAMAAREACGEVRLHINGQGVRAPMQLRLGACVRHHLIRPRKGAQVHGPALGWQAPPPSAFPAQAGTQL